MRTIEVGVLPVYFKRANQHNVPGFHAFRRFRITWLRDIGCPEDILRYWVGHQGFGITDRYSKLAENIELRKQWSARAGLGFSLDNIGKPGTHHGKPSAKAAKPKPNARKALLQREIVVERSLVRRKPVLSVPDVVEAPTSSAYVASDEDLDPFFATPVTVHEEV